MRIAVIGRGSAGALAAATVSHRLPEHTLWHIYDPRIPVIGVGEGTLPPLVEHLRSVTGLDDATVQRRLQATRKRGIHFEGWGRAHREFIHYFYDETYGYHLSADRLVELLAAGTRARQVDARVTRLVRVDGGTRIEFDGLPPERFDLVFDARGFPARLDPSRHIPIPFMPTNAAVIRRAPAMAVDVDHTYTRSVARPHGWVFVIPLTSHTSFGYIFNRRLTPVDEVERDFDVFLREQGVSTFERRAVIDFPNFIHRCAWDGSTARIGNAAAFMEPLEATALGLLQVQINAVLEFRRFMSPEEINRVLVRFAWQFGVFIAWHYSKGSVHDSDFWRHARDEAWPRYRDVVSEPLIDAEEQARRLDRRVELAAQLARWRVAGSMKSLEPFLSLEPFAAFRIPSFVDLAAGLGHAAGKPRPPAEPAAEGEARRGADGMTSSTA